MYLWTRTNWFWKSSFSGWSWRYENWKEFNSTKSVIKWSCPLCLQWPAEEPQVKQCALQHSKIWYFSIPHKRLGRYESHLWLLLFKTAILSFQVEVNLTALSTIYNQLMQYTVKHYFFHCILISGFSYVENLLDSNLADFYYQNSCHVIVYILQRILHITLQK